MITEVQFENFTAFTNLSMHFSPGINVLIGENGTGKTHIMKALYAACSVIDKKVNQSFDQKLRSVFLPNSIGRLVHRSQGRSSGKIKVTRRDIDDSFDRSISCRITTINQAEITSNKWQKDERNIATYIPVKDMLANAPSFRALYAQKFIHFEEVYSDIIDRALLPIPKGKAAKERARLLTILSTAVSGRVVAKDEQFYLSNKSGKLEFTLLAEGFRKLGLLYMLIQNETLTSGSVLFWDEPEANLNPRLSKTIVEIWIEVQKMGVQVFIATHDYSLLKEFDIASDTESRVTYHSLYKSDDTSIRCATTSDYDSIEHNSIDLAFQSMLDREINRGF